jgi:hypothetical protein
VNKNDRSPRCYGILEERNHAIARLREEINVRMLDGTPVE